MSLNQTDITNLKFGRLTPFKKGRFSSRKQYWFCNCDCGNQKEVDVYHLKTGHTQSCGCLRIERHQKPAGYKNYHYLYDKYKRNAENRNLSFELSEIEFIEIIIKNCYYCNSEPRNFNSYLNEKNELLDHVTRSTAERAWIKINGVDRMNNNLGYTLNNSVPCCTKCNFIKSDFELFDFISHIEKIYNHYIRDKK